MLFMRVFLKSTMTFGLGFLFRTSDLYMSLNATPAAVIGRIEEPEELNSNQLGVFGYLTRFIGNMTQDELRRFLRFVTGSSVLIDKAIYVTFNNLHDFARRPIAHTSSCTVELPTSYATYLEFCYQGFS